LLTKKQAVEKIIIGILQEMHFCLKNYWSTTH